MKLTVDFGDHHQCILAGIKPERTNAKEIGGKQALFVLNLPEKKMASEVSQGMLFDIGFPTILHLVLKPLGSDLHPSLKLRVTSTFSGVKQSLDSRV